MHRWTSTMLSVSALTMTISASAIAQPLNMPAKSNTSGFSIGLNLNGSTVRSPAEFKSEGGGLGVRLSYGLNQSVALYLGVDAAALSTENLSFASTYSVAHADLGVRISLADSNTATVPYVEGAYSRRAIAQDFAGQDLELTGDTATFGGGIQHFFNRRIALDAGLLFSYGKFTDAKVNGETFSDSGGDSIWSSRFNLGLRMHLR